MVDDSPFEPTGATGGPAGVAAGPAGVTKQAKLQIERSNIRFLQEIGRLARELGQHTTQPQVRDIAGRIVQCCDQVQSNAAVEERL